MTSINISYDEFYERYVDWALEMEFLCRGVNYFLSFEFDCPYIVSSGPGRNRVRTEYKTRQELVDNYRIDGKTIKEIFNEIEVTGIY